MTISRSDNKVTFTCNGSTHVFTFEFPIIDSGDLVVTLINTATGEETVLTSGTNYAVAASDSGYGGGGTVTTQAAGETGMEHYSYPAGYTILIQRSTPKTQLMDLRTGQVVDLQDIEDAFDKVQAQILDMQEQVDRSIKFPAQDSTALLSAIAEAASRANKFLSFDSSGNALASSGPIVGVIPTTYARPLLDALNAAAALATLGLDVDLATLSLPASTTISAFGKSLVDDTTKAAAKVTLGFPVTYVDDYAVGDGTTDDTMAIGSAITAATTGSILQFGPKTYKITDNITINKALTLQGMGVTGQINQVTSNKAAFLVTASNVTIQDLSMSGPQYAASVAGELAVSAYGADAAHYISGIKVLRCKMDSWGGDAVKLSFVTDFDVSDNTISNIFYCGIMALSCSRGWIDRNRITGITGTASPASGYGIAITRSNGALATYPRSADIKVRGNRVSNVTYWEAYDSHGGSHISFIDNYADGVVLGLNIGPSVDESGLYKIAPLYCEAIGNNFVSSSTSGTASYGICVTGAYDTSVYQYAIGCRVIGNFVNQFGDKTDGNSGGYYFHTTQGLMASNNEAYYCSPLGFSVYHDNMYPILTNNIALSPWADSGDCSGFRINGANNVGWIVSDSQVYDDASGKTVMVNSAGQYAVVVGNTSGNAGKLGLLSTNATSALSDSGFNVSKNLN